MRRAEREEGESYWLMFIAFSAPTLRRTEQFLNTKFRYEKNEGKLFILVVRFRKKVLSTISFPVNFNEREK